MSGNGYRGRSKATLELLEACKKILDETQPITVRGVCYRLFVAKLSVDGEPIPRPMSSRPLQNTSRDAICFAASSGFLHGTTKQATPRRTDRTSPAR